MGVPAVSKSSCNFCHSVNKADSVVLASAIGIPSSNLHLCSTQSCISAQYKETSPTQDDLSLFKRIQLNILCENLYMTVTNKQLILSKVKFRYQEISVGDSAYYLNGSEWGCCQQCSFKKINPEPPSLSATEPLIHMVLKMISMHFWDCRISSTVVQ